MIRQICGQTIDLTENALRMRDQCFACRGRANSSGVPLEKRHANRSFEIGNSSAGCRKREMRLLGAFADAAGSNHSDQQRNGNQVESMKIHSGRGQLCATWTVYGLSPKVSAPEILTRSA